MTGLHLKCAILLHLNASLWWSVGQILYGTQGMNCCPQIQHVLGAAWVLCGTASVAWSFPGSMVYSSRMVDRTYVDRVTGAGYTLHAYRAHHTEQSSQAPAYSMSQKAMSFKQ